MSERIISESWAVIGESSNTIIDQGFYKSEHAESAIKYWYPNVTERLRVARVRVVEVSEPDPQRRKGEA